MKTKRHRISIPSILEIGANKINEIGKILQNDQIKNTLLFFDPYIFELIGDKLLTNLKESKIKTNYKILDKIEFEELGTYAYDISGDVDIVIGIGGGWILDITKYICYLRKKDFLSIPTSSSNDGFSSPVASLYINNKRTTVPAKVPYGIIIDINLLITAPKILIYSGIGDAISNITAVYDMDYEKDNRNIDVDNFAKLASLNSVEVIIKYATSDIKSKEFLTKLMETLTMSGIAMEISGSSSPSSGSEHLISHAMDKQLGSNNYPHGIQVGIATYIVSIIQNNRVNDVKDFLTKTGFFDFVKTLHIKKKQITDAIKLAPSIKKYRVTTLHDKKNIEKAINIVNKDVLLNNILI